MTNLKKIRVTPNSDDTWTLTKDIRHKLHNGKTLIIKKGFITNFASIPWILTPILKREDRKYIYACIIHDYLYAHGFKMGYNRKFSDTEMFVIQSQEDNSLFRRICMHIAVRLLGENNFIKQ